MNFGLDIFTEAVADVYIVWKFGELETRIGDDINEKRNPETAPDRNATPHNGSPMHIYIRTRRAKILLDGVVVLNSST